mmetsp:Transcript_18785/g.39140  ORF Transcript_18785/g.39140 Transcript_18785/m.39140 type:complete len:355 (-) Transcript_18785:243-1307(-)
MPPMRSDSVGFFIRFSITWPCAVPTSMTPRSAMVLQASASASVPISSMITTSGMWFSTASTITLCCLEGSGTCILLALPMAGCGMSPSPPISFEVSTITTRLCSSSASTRAISLTTVVLPTPGRPSSSIEQGFSASSRSRIISTWPVTARPTRQVRPTTPPVRFRMALMRCSVPAMPARLSPPKAPTLSIAAVKSSLVITSSRKISSQLTPRNLALGLLPRSMTISSKLALSGWLARGSLRSEGRTWRMVSRSSRTNTLPSCSVRHSSPSPHSASAFTRHLKRFPPSLAGVLAPSKAFFAPEEKPAPWGRRAEQAPKLRGCWCDDARTAATARFGKRPDRTREDGAALMMTGSD